MGNLIFRKTARNSNPDIAGSCRITIAEVEEIVPAGSLDPDQIHTPGIFVQRIVKTNNTEKYIKKEISRYTDLKSLARTYLAKQEYLRKRSILSEIK